MWHPSNLSDVSVQADPGSDLSVYDWFACDRAQAGVMPMEE